MFSIYVYIKIPKLKCMLLDSLKTKMFSILLKLWLCFSLEYIPTYKWLTMAKQFQFQHRIQI